MAADMDLVTLMQEYDTDAECRAVLERLRWPDGVCCLKCTGMRVSRVPSRTLFQCNACNHQFSVTTGTIFHDSHLPLPKWILATYLMVESKKGMSALQMKRTLNVAYKTAWYLCHRIRAAMTEAKPEQLTGIVEVDETYVGGKVRGKGRGYRDNKTMVLGAIERGGNARLRVGGHATRKELYGFIRSTADLQNTRAVSTDEWSAYNGIGNMNTRHETVNHKAEEWVRGAVHTNSIENSWSLLDRSIMGAFHHVSEKHLDRYLDELEWRFNNRNNPHIFRETLRKLLASGNLEYQELTAK